MENKEFKVGDWVYAQGYGVSQIKEIKNVSYYLGYPYAQEIIESVQINSIIWNRLKLATKDQINQFLIEEAKRRYPIGCTVKSIYVSLKLPIEHN